MCEIRGSSLLFVGWYDLGLCTSELSECTEGRRVECCTGGSVDRTWLMRDGNGGRLMGGRELADMVGEVVLGGEEVK